MFSSLISMFSYRRNMTYAGMYVSVKGRAGYGDRHYLLGYKASLFKLFPVYKAIPNSETSRNKVMTGNRCTLIPIMTYVHRFPGILTVPKHIFYFWKAMITHWLQEDSYVNNVNLIVMK